MNFKEITGLPRSHIVEEFTAQLEKKFSERGDSVTIPKVSLCLKILKATGNFIQFYSLGSLKGVCSTFVQWCSSKREGMLPSVSGLS